VWPVRLYRAFPRCLKNGRIIGEKMIVHWTCFDFLTSLSETFFVLRRIQPDIIIHAHRSSCKVPVILIRFLTKLELYREIFENISSIKFRKNPSIWSRVVPCGKAGGYTRHDEATSSCSRFCERAEQVTPSKTHKGKFHSAQMSVSIIDVAWFLWRT
jgi:hypothetical protein